MTDIERAKTPAQIVPVSSTTTAPNLPNYFRNAGFVLAYTLPARPFKQDAESPMPFLEIMNRSVVAWVDYITDDPIKDIPVVAAQMGFSEAFIASLSGDSQLHYRTLIRRCGCGSPLFRFGPGMFNLIPW